MACLWIPKVCSFFETGTVLLIARGAVPVAFYVLFHEERTVNREVSWRWRGVLILAVVAMAGCGRGPLGDEDLIKAANRSNIHRLTNLYSAFADQNRGVGPKDEKQFRGFVAKVPQEQLARMGIDGAALDSLFLNERDSQPFEIKYGQKKPDGRGQTQGGSGKVPDVAVVLESAGVNGVRQAGFLGTRVVKNIDGGGIAKNE